MGYSEAEKREIYEIYVRCGYNKKRARREYQRIHGLRRNQPNCKTFKRIYDQVTNNNSFKRKIRMHQGGDNENIELNVLLHFQGKLKILHLFNIIYLVNNMKHFFRKTRKLYSECSW